MGVWGNNKKIGKKHTKLGEKYTKIGKKTMQIRQKATSLIAKIYPMSYNWITGKGKNNMDIIGGVDMYSAMYDYRDIANYIIAYKNNKQESITNLQLQKIMYYIQGYFLKEFEELAFDSDIVNWPYGPVVLDAYYDFCIYGHKSIEQLNNLDEAISKIRNKSHRNLINSIIDKCCQKSITSLVDGTHAEDPWKDTKRREVISSVKIFNYFLNNNPLEIKLD